MLDENQVAQLRAEFSTLRDLLCDYGDFMGDYWPSIAPWRLEAAEYPALVSAGLAEGSLLIALNVLWGIRDGAHTISPDDQAAIDAMTLALRDASALSAVIAGVIDLVESDASEAACAIASSSLLREHMGIATRE